MNPYNIKSVVSRMPIDTAQTAATYKAGTVTIQSKYYI